MNWEDSERFRFGNDTDCVETGVLECWVTSGDA